MIAERRARGAAESPGDITRRELYFFTLSRLFGPHPLLFHLFNAFVLLLTVGMVFALARRLAGGRAAALAAGVYAVLYAHRIQMAWVSCSQDLIASALGVGAALLYVRGRRVASAFVFFARSTISR